jgi:hypothetical protein
MSNLRPTTSMRVLVIGAGTSIEEAKRTNVPEKFWIANGGRCSTSHPVSDGSPKTYSWSDGKPISDSRSSL